jgi:pre-rRNA-processing protein IPI1
MGRHSQPGPGSQGKKRPADFEKVKSKVGKKLKPAANVTNTSFKSRAIHMTLQTQAADGEAQTHRGQTLKDLLSKLSHPNNTIRKEALAGIKSFYELNTEQLASASILFHMFEKIVPLVHDSSQSVRKALLSLLAFIFPQLSGCKMTPFFSLFVAHISSAMTQLNGDIRGDSLDFIDLFLSNYPALTVHHGSVLFDHFLQLVSDQDGDASARAVSVGFDGRLTTMRTRTRVLRCMHTFMAAAMQQLGDADSSGALKRASEPVELSWSGSSSSVCLLRPVAAPRPTPPYVFLGDACAYFSLG